MIKNKCIIYCIMFGMLFLLCSGWAEQVTNRSMGVIYCPPRLSTSEVVNVYVITNNTVPVIFEDSKQFVPDSVLDNIIMNYGAKAPDHSPVWFMYVYKQIPEIPEYLVFYKNMTINARLRKGSALIIWGLSKHESLYEYYQVVSDNNTSGLSYPIGKEMPFLFEKHLSDATISSDDIVAIYNIIPGRLPIKEISIKKSIVTVITYKIRGHWYGVVYKLAKTNGSWVVIDSYSAKQ